MTLDKLIKSAIHTVFALTAVSTVATNALAAKQQTPAQSALEKCYGIVKAGMNDCATATESCAGSAKKDNQPDAFILLNKGLCAKIVGGNLNPPKKA